MIATFQEHGENEDDDKRNEGRQAELHADHILYHCPNRARDLPNGGNDERNRGGNGNSQAPDWDVAGERDPPRVRVIHDDAEDNKGDDNETNPNQGGFLSHQVPYSSDGDCQNQQRCEQSKPLHVLFLH